MMNDDDAVAQRRLMHEEEKTDDEQQQQRRRRRVQFDDDENQCEQCLLLSPSICDAHQRLIEVNRQWNNMPPPMVVADDEQRRQQQRRRRRVQFCSENPVVNVALEYDRTNAELLRKIADDQRFHDRIKRTDQLLSFVLSDEHRSRVFNQQQQQQHDLTPVFKRLTV